MDSLDQGLLACADPERLQALCDQLGPADVHGLFDRWAARLPAPVTATDRAAGYTHRLALQQVEVSCTQVLARPVPGRHCFEAVIRENLDLGRPDRVGLRLPHRITRRTPPPTRGSRTRVITDGVEPRLHSEYTSSHVKQSCKEPRALRPETPINNPNDVHVNQGIPNLTPLRDRGDQVNRTLLDVDRVSHHCVLTQDALDRRQRPPVEAGQRTAALRVGAPRVMALVQALTACTPLPHGFRNRDLRPQVETLLGRPSSAAQMSDALRRRRLNGVIHRIPTTHR